MRVGVVLVGDWPAIARAAQIVDASTMDCLGFWDHFQPLGFNTAAVNGWAVYGCLAAVTQRVRLCPLVLDGPNYILGRLAKETSIRLFLHIYPPYTYLPDWCELVATTDLDRAERQG